MEIEQWKNIVKFEKYSVSNTGKIKNNDSDKILKQRLNKSGYMQVSVKPNGRQGKSKTFRIHRVLAVAWIPNPNDLPQVNHKDGIKTNNTISNLEWVTHQQNIRHAFDNNLVPIKRGVDTSSAVLTDELVRCIREEYSNGGVTLRQLGVKYGVAHNTLSCVVTRNSWKHVK